MTLARTALAALALAALPAAAQERPTIVVGAPDFRPLPIAVTAFQGEGDARDSPTRFECAPRATRAS